MKLIKEIFIENEGALSYPILTNGKGWVSSETTNDTLIESGERFVLMNKIVSLIDNAKEFICLQSFLIQTSPVTEALKRASDKGVKVYILSSAEARLKDTIEEEQDFIKADYIKLLTEVFRNRFIHRSAENFHAKYILVDPKSNPKGFICTNNFTLNGFSKNPELAVELNSDQCTELFKVFTYHFWEHSSSEQTEGNEFASVKPVGKFNIEPLEHLLITSPNPNISNLEAELVRAIKDARKEIVLTTYSLDKSNAVIQALIEKAKNGIDVSVFARVSERLYNEHLKDLLDTGIKIYLHPLTHAKSLLIDSEQGYVFTANIIDNGMKTGFEVGLKLNDQQSTSLLTIIERWKSDYPFKALKAANIKSLTEVVVFTEGKLSKRLILEEKKDIPKRITKVSDLIQIFNQTSIINDKYTKSIKVKNIAELAELPEQYRKSFRFSDEKYLVQNIEEGKGLVTKILAVPKSFTIDDIQLIHDHKDLKIYYM